MSKCSLYGIQRTFGLGVFLALCALKAVWIDAPMEAESNLALKTHTTPYLFYPPIYYTTKNNAIMKFFQAPRQLVISGTLMIDKP